MITNEPNEGFTNYKLYVKTGNGKNILIFEGTDIVAMCAAMGRHERENFSAICYYDAIYNEAKK